jgi:iron complex outermembrane receptor protein
MKSVLPRRLPLVMALLSVPCAALAQTAAPESSTTATDATLPAVTVSDKKDSPYAPTTSESGPYRGNLLDVPATINVVSRELMDAQGATGLYDALRNVAGVVRQQQSGIAYDQLSIRGINLDNRSSYMFNGVLPFDNNLPIPMEDKERMEVLKGAAALYYGFITPGGIVNMTTKRAGNTPVTSLTLSTDNNGSTLAHVDLSRRFGEDQQFGVRINAVTNNVHTPIDNDNGYRRMFSAAFDWRVNRQLTLRYDAEFIKASVTEQAAIVPQAAVGGVITLPSIPDPSKLRAGVPQPIDVSRG